MSVPTEIKDELERMSGEWEREEGKKWYVNDNGKMSPYGFYPHNLDHHRFMWVMKNPGTDNYSYNIEIKAENAAYLKMIEELDLDDKFDPVLLLAFIKCQRTSLLAWLTGSNMRLRRFFLVLRKVKLIYEKVDTVMKYHSYLRSDKFAAQFYITDAVKYRDFTFYQKKDKQKSRQFLGLEIENVRPTYLFTFGSKSREIVSKILYGKIQTLEWYHPHPFGNRSSPQYCIPLPHFSPANSDPDTRFDPDRLEKPLRKILTNHID